MGKIKSLFVVICLILVGGFSISGCACLDNTDGFLCDPHFKKYQDKKDELESWYLRGKIDYAEYKRKRDDLDAQYDHEVDEREKSMDFFAPSDQMEDFQGI